VTKEIKIYIVEDVAISRISLETMLVENEYEVSGSAAAAETAWNEIQQTATDLILLDINLAGEKNGVWLAQQVRKHLNIPIVYLTAFGDQQTLKDVLDTKPNGYLMKPYQEPTLLTTISIAISNFENEGNKNQLVNSQDDASDFVFVKDRNMKVKINVNDICYVKSDGNYIEIVLKEKKYVVRNKLLEFKKELPNDIFIQCHQRYVVDIHKISMLGKDFIHINGSNIPLSSKYKKDFENSLTKL